MRHQLPAKVLISELGGRVVVVSDTNIRYLFVSERQIPKCLVLNSKGNPEYTLIIRAGSFPVLTKHRFSLSIKARYFEVGCLKATFDCKGS